MAKHTSIVMTVKAMTVRAMSTTTAVTTPGPVATLITAIGSEKVIYIH